jgi:multiple sugar transport system permease protein/raffinose/stachyose/melibiose transport system permease protein
MVPAMVLFGLFVAYPTLWMLWTSLTTKDAATVGGSILGNYLAVFEDSIFWVSAKNMVFWAVLTIAVQTTLGAALAYVVETYTKRTRTLFRTIFFLPVVTSVSVIAVVWEAIYAPSYGPLQAYLADLGFHYSGNLLGNPATAIFAAIGVNIWEFTGFSMFLYMVALHRIPSELLDAAIVDGATGWRLTRHVLAPLLSPTTRSLVLLGIVGTLQTFPLVYLLTDGGPNNASQIFGTYIFTKAFVENELGYGSALSVVVLAIAMIATAVQLRVFKSPAGLGVEGQ